MDALRVGRARGHGTFEEGSQKYTSFGPERHWSIDDPLQHIWK